MINTKSQWSIQRSSSWATNYTGPGTGFDTGTFLAVGARTQKVGLEGGASHDSGVNATSRPHAVMFSLHYKLCSTSNFEAVKIAE